MERIKSENDLEKKEDVGRNKIEICHLKRVANELKCTNEEFSSQASAIKVANFNEENSNSKN